MSFKLSKRQPLHPRSLKTNECPLKRDRLKRKGSSSNGGTWVFFWSIYTDRGIHMGNLQRSEVFSVVDQRFVIFLLFTWILIATRDLFPIDLQKHWFPRWFTEVPTSIATATLFLKWSITNNFNGFKVLQHSKKGWPPLLLEKNPSAVWRYKRRGFDVWYDRQVMIAGNPAALRC